MDGTWVIHPQQAEIANACYTPSDEQVDEARRVVKLYHEKGGGSMADPKTGEMIDEATIKIALMDLAKGVAGRAGFDAELRDWSAKSRDDHRLRHPGTDAPRAVRAAVELTSG